MTSATDLSDKQFQEIEQEIWRVFRERMNAPAEIAELLSEADIPGDCASKRVKILKTALNKMVDRNKLRIVHPGVVPSSDSFIRMDVTYVPV